MLGLLKKIGFASLIVLSVAIYQVSSNSGEDFARDRFEKINQRNSKQIQRMLWQTSGEINESLPMMVDADTRLNSTVPVENSFMYDYTLVNHEADEIDNELFESTIREQLVAGYCSTMRTLADQNIPVIYRYTGRDEIQISLIEIRPEECK